MSVALSRLAFALFSFIAASGSIAAAGLPATGKPVLTLDSARRIIHATAAEAHRLNAGGTIAIVDDGGHLLLLERLDNTFPASAPVATGKARTAAQFRRPTSDFENAVKSGRASLLGVNEMVPLQGGVPLAINGVVVGAIGVSGAQSAQQDDELARFGVAFFDKQSTGNVAPVSYFDRTSVDESFAKGAVLLNQNGDYQIHTSRREKPGMAEVHTQDTDVIHVLEGSTTFVTGGTVVEGKAVASGEIRGVAIEGGDTRILHKGDVVVVPNGTPHWFKEVNGTVLYYVVKVRAAQ